MANDILTKLENLINPEVMADMISAKIPSKIVVAPFATIDTTLEGSEGDTITVPQYAYIGDAEDVAEGVECDTSQLTASSTQVTVKKAMKAVNITDEAVLSGHGDTVGEATSQLAKSVASKVDRDCMSCLTKVYAVDENGKSNGGVQLIYRDTANKIKYSNIVEAIGLFEEEVQSEKVMFVHPDQLTTLRLDADFISADKYPNNVVMRGEVGMICGTRIVSSRKVAKNPLIEAKYRLLTSAPEDWETMYTSYFTKSGSTYSAVTGDTAPSFTTDTYYVKVTDRITANTCWMNPIIKLNNDAESEDDAPAITIYMKRKIFIEKERKSLKRTTIVSADQHYTASLSNTAKVVLAFIKA